MTTTSASAASSEAKPAGASISWTPLDPDQIEEAKERLEVWPLDEYNAKLLNEVHPLGYQRSSDQPHEVYDLIGTFVSVRQMTIACLYVCVFLFLGVCSCVCM